MKTAIILVIVILIAIISFVVFNPKKEVVEENSNQEPVQQQNNEEEQLLSVEDGVYSVKTEESIINWTGKKKVLTNWIDKGTIKIQSGNLTIENGQVTSNELIIDMNSIEAQSTGSGGGQSSLTNHLKSDDFFDVENNPTSSFIAKEIRLGAPNQFEVIGDLTIKGNTNEVIIPVTVYKTENEYRATGGVDLDRTLWDIRFGSDKFFDNLGDNIIDDIINIEFELIAEKNG